MIVGQLKSIERILDSNISSLATVKNGSSSFVITGAMDRHNNTTSGNESWILIRNLASVNLDEWQRAIHDCIRVLETTFKDPRIVPGAGACELSLCEFLLWKAMDTKSSLSFDIGEAYIIKQYALSLLEIPRILALNSGQYSLSLLEELRSIHAKAVRDSEKQQLGNGIVPLLPAIGIHATLGLCDVLQAGVVEPLENKISQISMATETALQILKIDGIVNYK